MIATEQKSEILNLLSKMEESLVVTDAGTNSIAALCEVSDKKSKLLLESIDPLTPILRTALVINWRESSMQSRYDRFRKLYPAISNLSDLQNALDSTDAMLFCKDYLDIKANPLKPDANPKYALLKTLTKGFLEYKVEFGFAAEIDAIRHWALNLKVSELKKDSIGKRKGVGIGVVENIRLNLGYPVIKPDRHVIGVMKQCFKLDIPCERYIEFATLLGLNARYLDCVLFEYGKLKKISD